VALYSASFAVLALGWSGRAAWVVALCGLAYLVPVYYLADVDSWVAALMFTVPAFAAGTALRLRNETARELELRAGELESERELFGQIALRHERARIASELHDIIGHAISVMVIQAAAGQRLVDADPGAGSGGVRRDLGVREARQLGPRAARPAPRRRVGARTRWSRPVAHRRGGHPRGAAG
jgi:signal transduction histidine kinase